VLASGLADLGFDVDISPLFRTPLNSSEVHLKPYMACCLKASPLQTLASLSTLVCCCNIVCRGAHVLASGLADLTACFS
jgi:hypothetical protein